MTTTLDAAKKRPTLDQILKAAPMLCRASIDLDPAAGTQPDTLSATLPDGTALTDEMIDGLLERCRLGQRVEIDVRMLAYEQWDFEKFPGKDNRNYVCFRGGEMRSLGSTGKRKPFLRDHEQGESLARGGTLIESKTEEPEDGHHQIFQKVRLSAPWAVEMYLRGLMTTVSIGWIPTGPVLCSACNAPVFEKCGGWFGHWPGDRLKEIVDTETGEKRYVRSSKGTILVRWIYTAAELIETSCVPVPGVPTAEMDQLRATLAASFPGLSLDEDEHGLEVPHDKSPPPALARSVDPTTEPSTETKMADQPAPDLAKFRRLLAVALCLPEEHRKHAAGLDDIERESFLGLPAADRGAAVQAALDADPIEFAGVLTGFRVRRSEGERAKQFAEAAELAAAANKRHEATLAEQAAEREASEVSTICRTKLASLPGSDETHTFIVGALRKSGGTKEQIDAALLALAAASTNIAKQAKAPGFDLGEDARDENAKLAWDRQVAAFAKANGISDYGLAAERFLDTTEGRRAKQAYDDSRAYGQGGHRGVA